MIASTTQTVAQFIAKHGITCKISPVKPTADEAAQWPKKNYTTPGHFAVTVLQNGKQMTIRFHTGNGRTPDLEDVLDCVASDSMGFENNPKFEDWAGDYGYKIDDDAKVSELRQAERIYKAVKRQAAKAKKFLGEDVYKELLENTERM